MIGILPGSTLEADIVGAETVRRVIRPLFAAGGLTLSQTAAVSGAEPHDIQNWVKRGFLTKPVGRMYSCDQLCRVIMIRMLRESLQLERITDLLRYINGHLDDESDDALPDSELYGYLLEILVRSGALTGVCDPARLAAVTDEVVSSCYTEKYDGAADRLRLVLRVTVTAWLSARIRRDAETLIASMDLTKGASHV